MAINIATITDAVLITLLRRDPDDIFGRIPPPRPVAIELKLSLFLFDHIANCAKVNITSFFHLWFTINIIVLNFWPTEITLLFYIIGIKFTLCI
ncbi:MAG TPA: hypothetical protein VIP70_03835 [Nitrososphaeraceae archaeon]